jgi:glycosyltransferase involved in cell wall biosynthesis
LVFTYNRAEKLHRTLARLLESPFARCRITVLDNCSPDRTPQVCAEFVERLKRLRIVRHPRNIGLGANYLRAVELSRAPYTWILSDDEQLDFGDCSDVLFVIEQGDVDLISLGSPGQHEWERGMRSSTQELLALGQRFFWVWTFAAGVIFRTGLFDDQSIREGYGHLYGDYAHFPHFGFLYKALQEDASVYVSRRAMVAREEEHVPRTSSSLLWWMVDMIRPTKSIPDPELRRTAVYQGARSRPDWFFMMAEVIAFEKIEHQGQMWRPLGELALALTGEQRLMFLFMIPVAIVPRPVLLGVRASVRSLRRLGLLHRR